MRVDWDSAKPADKRGTNKANMDAPQEEFIADTPVGGAETEEDGGEKKPAEGEQKYIRD